MGLHPPRGNLSPTPLTGRTLVTHGSSVAGGHEEATHDALARRLARLLGLTYGGAFDVTNLHGPYFHMPREALFGSAVAEALALEGEHDLFGGWVPFDFMATKAIMHPLVPGATPPEGWIEALPARAVDLTLRGYTAFARKDARNAGRALLENGPARLKAVHASGGLGQAVLRNIPEMEVALDDLGEPFQPVVIEEDLTDTETYSVGQVRLGGMVASYCGMQSLAPDNAGRSAYGGSNLLVARGGYDDLLRLPLPDRERTAVALGRGFDDLAEQYIPGLLASRRNYDIAFGIAADGTPRAGVLEQSWRVGGATGAEIAALEALAQDDGLLAVRASTVEAYGAHDLPSGAELLYQGEDARIGLITKYTLVGDRIFAKRHS